MAGIRLVYSHRLETLARELAVYLSDRVGDPSALFQPVDIVVPNWNIRTYLEQEISRWLGVTPNLRFRLLRGFLADHLPEHGKWARTQILGRKQLHHILVDLLADSEGDWLHECEEIRAYLSVEDEVARERRLYQLCAELSRIFTEYSFSRSAPVHGPDLDDEPLLVKWRQLGADGPERLEGIERWQQTLWWRVFGDGGVLCDIEEREQIRFVTLADALGQVSVDELQGPPDTFHVVGFSYIARLFIEAIGLLGERAQIYVHALSPCSDWVAESPMDFPDQDTHLLLQQWGSAGADHAMMWAKMADQVELSVPNEPEHPNLLTALQADIIDNSDKPRPGPTGDDGVQFFECPSITREVEAVANEVWTLLRRESTLRPDDIAVVIAGADRDAYLAQIETVFSGFRRLPHTIVDLPASSESRLLEAVELLLALPFGRFTRRELLRLLVHPNMRGQSADLDPDEWVRWCDQLGILYAANRQEQGDSYLGGTFEVGGCKSYEWDLYNWDQGMRRLVLGTFLSAKRSGVESLFSIENRDYEPLEVADGNAAQAARFVTLASSLIEDARWLVGLNGEPPERSAREWADIVETYLSTYIAPTTQDDDAYQHSACQRIVRQVAEQSPGDGRMSYRMFYEFVRDELEALQRTRGNFLTGGVVVSACLPMRAIPFEHIFVLGLGEGQFPNPEREDPLDLRYRNPQRGDLEPADRDRYTFLETLLAARRSVTLSWVAREATTGEPLEPSSVVNELRWTLERRFDIPAESTKKLTVRHPLRRFDYQYFPALARAAKKSSLAAVESEGEDGQTLALNEPSLNLHPEARAEAKLQALHDRLADTGSGRLRRVPSLDELRRLLADSAADADSRHAWMRLRDELALPLLPSETSHHVTAGEASDNWTEPDAPAEPRRVRIRLSQLKDFLESPLQGAAKVQLGLREDADDPFGLDREPVQANRLHRTIALREVVYHALRTNTPADELASLYEELLLPRAPLDGRLPSGHFLRHDQTSQITSLETWWSNLEHLGITPPLVRLGIGVERDDLEQTFEPIELHLTPQTHGIPEPIIVEVVGTTEPTSPDAGVYIHFAESSSRTPNEKYYLRVFLSWVAATAAGREHPEEVRLAVNGTKDHGSSTSKIIARFTRQYASWSSTAAAEYLATLCASLLFEPHDYLLPIQFAAAVRDEEASQRTADTLKSWLEKQLSSSYCSASSQYGPIKDFRRFGAPRDLDVDDVLRTRFPHLFEEAQ